MSKIGSFLNNRERMFEANNTGGDLASAISAINNVYSEFNNANAGNNKEAFRSFLLLTQDVVDLFPNSNNLNIVNNLVRVVSLSDRLALNVNDYIDTVTVGSTKYNNGFVKKTLILDIFSDATAIFSELSKFTRASPLGVVVNIFSMIFAAISNGMNLAPEWNDRQLIHKDEILDLFLDGINFVLENSIDVLQPMISTVENYIPDGLNPWAGDAIILMDDKTGGNEIKGNYNRKYTIFGNDGVDILIGNKLEDYLAGGDDNDFLYGGAGNDVLIGGSGSDELYGGAGDDVLVVSEIDTSLSGAENAAKLDQVANKAFGGSGSDTIYGGNGDDELYAGDETNDQNDAGTTNKVYGLGGNDELVGGAGTDFLYGGQGEDRLYGGDGGDNLYLAHDSSPDKIALDTSNNFAEGGAGNDTIHGSDGRDIIFTAEDGKGSIDEGTTNYAWGYKGNDILKGGNGKDFIYGGEDKDYLHGGIGDDKLYGGENGDFLYGEEGNDELYAGRNKDDQLDTENNFLYGGQGDDKLFGGKGYDILEGGEGFDTYKAYYKTLVKDEDGSGILYYNNKSLLGAEMRYKSESLSPPPTLDFSSKGYDINNKSTEGGRLSKIAEGKNWVRYIVLGDINFKYKELTTEDLDTRSKTDTDLGVRFYVTVYKDNAEPPPPIYPKPRPPLTPPPTPPTKYDPLVLDLNHDGKISTTPLGTDIYFDLDGNSFAEKTSWVQATDGFVALDLNENGKIDNGKELFGTDTILPDGSKASDGFKALEQYDLNKDGFINGSDIIFQKLKIWKDTNQDGISQSNELFSLSNLGITSISLNNQLINATDDNNVIHTNKGSFTQTVTENGATQIKSGLAETLLFEVNTSETIWQNPNETSENIDTDISELPDFPGYGSATSLHNAMQLDLTGKLKELVSSFAETSSDQQILLAHQILYFWTNNKISTATNVANISSHEKFEIVKVLYGKELEWKNWNPGNVNDLDGYFQKILSSAYVQLLSQTVKQDWMDLIVFQEERLYEATDPFPLTPPTGQGGAHIYSDPKIYTTTWDSLKPSKQYVNIFDPSQTSEVNWILKNTIWHGDFSQAIKGLTNLFFMDYEVGKNEIEQFQFIVKELDPNSPVLYKELIDQFTLSVQSIQDENIRDLLLESIFVLDDSIKGSEENDQIKSWAGDDSISSLGGEDIIYAGNGDDRVYAGDGADIIYGGDDNDNLLGERGDDLLNGDLGDDILYGGAGDDLIYGNEGSDILRGHSGVDTLDGGTGDDKYFYYLTDGPDVIDQTGGGVDVLWLMDNGITRDRIQFTKEENDLIVTIDNNTNQSIRIVDHFLDGEKAISAVQPNNGYTISKVEINALFASEIEEPNPPIEGGIYDTSANDALVGGIEDNIFFYTAGKDTIQDAGGIDILRFSNGITFNQVGSGLMKTGNDLVLKVNGSTTNQVTLKNYFLAGDHLIETIDFETGGQLTAEQIFNAFGVTLPETEQETGSTDVIGDTTYQYTIGELTITEQSGTDKVIFKNGLTFSQVANYLTKFGDDLILKVDGSNTNKVTVKNFFLAGQYLVESFQFETGGQLSAAQIFGAFGITMPTIEPENPTEPESVSVVGNTTYDYTTGSLTITEQSGNDTVVFKNGIGFSQVANYLTMSGDDLILKVDGSNTNKVTVKNFFLAGAYLVEIFQFETGGQITAEQIFGAFGLTVPEQNNPETSQPETGLEAMNSTYTYTSGTLQIDEDYGVDEIVFSNGISFNQVASQLMMSGDDLVLKIDGSNTDKVTIKNFFLGGAHEVESLSFETGGSISSSQIYQAFGLDRPLNAEDEISAVVLGDTGDNTLVSDAAVSELFILDQGQDMIQLLQNASGEAAKDYVSDFSLVDDKIDLSAVFVNSQVNNSNLDDYLQVFYDADAKTNTLSVRTSVNNMHKDMLVFTNQAEQLYVDDLLLNQSIMY